jgi:hypothetical protein
MPARGDIYWQARPNQGNTVKMSTHTHLQLGKIKTHTHTKPVFAELWHFGMDPDPRIRTVPLTNITDPVLDPAIFVSDIQDGNKKLLVPVLFFLGYLLLLLK